jgi:hypothetical protein
MQSYIWPPRGNFVGFPRTMDRLHEQPAAQLGGVGSALGYVLLHSRERLPTGNDIAQLMAGPSSSLQADRRS